jgi:mRNA interferase MazF
MRRGEIYLVNFGPIVGREQGGNRPVLVVSSHEVLSRPLVVTVVPGTDGANVLRDYEHSVRVPASDSGLRLDTVFLCFQIRALDRSRFSRLPIGFLPSEWMKKIDAALRYSLDLPDPSP